MSHPSMTEENYNIAQNLRNLAAEGRHDELRDTIIALGDVDIASLLNSHNRDDDMTALILAAENNHPECERILLLNGADPRVIGNGTNYLDSASKEIIEEFHLEELAAERAELRREMEEMDNKSESDDDSLAANLRRSLAEAAAEEERAKARAAEERAKERAMERAIIEEDFKEMEDGEESKNEPAANPESPRGAPAAPPRSKSL